MGGTLELWRSEWQRVQARMLGWEALAAAYFENTKVVGQAETGHMNQTAHESASAMRAALQEFSATCAAHLPSGAVQAIQRFDDAYPRTRDMQGVARVRLLALQLRTELEHLFHGTEHELERCAERVFALLQRQIVADVDVRKKWQDAFVKGEIECEKLGAIGLLVHGLFGFKVNAEGERTDLVYGGKLAVDAQLRAAGNGIVLTEWKIVRRPSEGELQRDSGIAQARRYSEGCLHGMELRRTRYIVLVSEEHLVSIDSTVQDGTMYRVVNLAVKPSTPSKSSRA